MPSCELLLAYVEEGTGHSKLPFIEFTELAAVLVTRKYTPVLRACKKELMKKILHDWIPAIEKAAKTRDVSDAATFD